ncbi:putative zinc metalloprotease [Xylogone sp. PMI_703]|nr:putative zinc metalloprotease [Xylogone sp. PMI_703]
MVLFRFFLCLLGVTIAVRAEKEYVYEPLPVTFGSNGFANWGAGNWPSSTVGVPLVPQKTDNEILSFLKTVDPARIQSTIQTLVNFGTRHTASTTTSRTRGIGAAREWLLKEMTALAAPSKGLIKVSIPCYDQPADPANDLLIAVKLCNVQAEITGSVDPNRTYVYTGHYDSRRLNNSDFTNDAPGADDNASAVAIALELVRVLASVVTKTRPAASIIIAAVAGEEQGLYGSKFLAQTLKNASVNVQGNFNDDIVGSGSNAPFNPLNQHTIRIFGAGTDRLALPSNVIAEFISTGYHDDTPSRHLGRFVQEVNAGAAGTTDMEVALIYKPDRFFRGGDHESFLTAGFPAVRFTEPQEDFYHQHQDPRTQDGILYGDEIQFVDSEYTARVGRVNLLSLWSIANAPGTPTNFTYDTNIGFLADSRSTPASWLENVIKLYWNTEPVDPLVDHYEIVWRPMSSQQWTHMLNVGKENTITLPISKDNAVFGLRAVGKNGMKSPATYALAVASQFFG